MSPIKPSNPGSTSRKGNILDNLLGRKAEKKQSGNFTHVYDALVHLKKIVPVDSNNEMRNKEEVIEIIDAAKQHIENLHISLQMMNSNVRRPVDFSFLDTRTLTSPYIEDFVDEDKQEADSDEYSSEYDLSSDIDDDQLIDDAQLIEEPCLDDNHADSLDSVTEYIEKRIEESILARKTPKHKLFEIEDEMDPEELETETPDDCAGEELTIYDMTGMEFVVETVEI